MVNNFVQLGFNEADTNKLSLMLIYLNFRAIGYFNEADHFSPV